jgi:hypothetical protein
MVMTNTLFVGCLFVFLVAILAVEMINLDNLSAAAEFCCCCC